MNEETDLFMTYWPAGLHYLKGGVDSGFKHVEPESYEPRLLLVKGKRHPRVFDVPVEAASLNEGDTFVLDMGMKLYYWAGAESNIHEKSKAAEIAIAIKNHDRHNKAKLYHPRDVGGVAEEEFWAALGGKPESIRPAVPDEVPDNATEAELMKYALYHISDASGSLVTTEVTERPLTRAHLNDNDSYILELHNQVYVWQGKGSSNKEKMMGVKIAKDFITEKGKPKNTKIHRIPQGIEDAQFKSYFDGFYAMAKQDFAKGKDEAYANTHANQDMEALTKKKLQAAKMVLDKLGANYTKTVYYLDANF